MSEATQCTQNVHEEPSEFLTKQVAVGGRFAPVAQLDRAVPS